MELYIEKDFLDYLDKDYNNTYIQNIVKSMFEDYGNKKVFFDAQIDEKDIFENFKNTNQIFALMCSNDKPPIPVLSIKEHILSKSNFNQTIVFTSEEESWFDEAKNKGALCFSTDTYEKEISNIIDSLHFKIDLSEPFNGWGFLKSFSVLNFNKLRISDSYILSDKTNQKVDDNIIPILKALLDDRMCEINIETLTKDVSPIGPEEKYKKEKVKKIHKKFNRIFANSKAKFSVIMNDIGNKFVMHDRIISTNYSLLDCGEGFNLIPHKKSNSQIISETIFEKYTYKRLNNLLKEQDDYIDKLNKLETVKFKMYP